MKSNARTSLYFSAYPLKAITEPSGSATSGSPYLKSALAGTGSTRSASRTRVFPMANPYPKKMATPRVQQSPDLSSGNEWFNNYE